MKYIIYDSGDEFVIHRNYVKQFLEEGQEQIEDKNFRKYVIDNNSYLLKQVAKMNDEYIGLSIHPMDDCFYINQDLLEWIGE